MSLISFIIFYYLRILPNMFIKRYYIIFNVIMFIEYNIIIGKKNIFKNNFIKLFIIYRKLSMLFFFFVKYEHFMFLEFIIYIIL